MHRGAQGLQGVPVGKPCTMVRTMCGGELGTLLGDVEGVWGVVVAERGVTGTLKLLFDMHIAI